MVPLLEYPQRPKPNSQEWNMPASRVSLTTKKEPLDVPGVFPWDLTGD